MGLAASKNEALWEAAGFGHTHRVRKFIEEGCDVNWVSYTHNSCAIHVAAQGKDEIVKMLIEAKCDVNAKDDRGNLALHHAAMNGHTQIMQMLIDAGSEINVQEKNGWTALINAAYFGQPSAVEVLIKNNCDTSLLNKDERHALHEACRSQSNDENGLAIIACHLLEAGCDMNLKSSDVGEADFTSLMFAAYHGHAEVAEVLAEAGCDINAQGSNGWTALHWAADRGHKEVMRVLLEWGIDPLLEGRRGELAVDRVQDNEIKEMLAEVTQEARDLREKEKFLSRSPVSTTSPMSSRRSSHASDLDADDENTETIENDLSARLEALAKEAGKEAESYCTSGTISEKDEKEILEKDINDLSPCCESLPEDVTTVDESSDFNYTISTVDIVTNETVDNIHPRIQSCEVKDSEYLVDNVESNAEENICSDLKKCVLNNDDTVNINNVKGSMDSSSECVEYSSVVEKSTQQEVNCSTEESASSDYQQNKAQNLIVNSSDSETLSNAMNLKNIALSQSLASREDDDGNFSDHLLQDGGYSDNIHDSD